MKNLLNYFQKDLWRTVFISTIITGLIAIVTMCLSAGMSGDEHFHAKHAGDVYEFYRTFGADSTAVTFTESNYLPSYGQAVDNFSYAIYRWFGNDNEMTIRHIVNSIFGWLAMLFMALIGYRINKKWSTAIIIFLLAFFSPRFLGHSFNNLKDLNLGTAMIMGLYYIIVFLQEFPKVRISTQIMLALSIGFAIAVRIGGLLLIVEFGFFAAIFFIQHYKLQGIWQKPNNALFQKLFVKGLIIVIGGYLFALLLWPYALVSPIGNVTKTFGEMSKFGISIRQVFEGSSQWSDFLPWYYTPKFILITIPTALIIGLVLYFTLFWKDKKNWFYYFVVFFAFFFPIFWIVYTNANVYGGWRHALFAYPPMVVAAGLGFELLGEWLQTKFQNLGKQNLISGAVIALVALLLWHPIRHVFKNHPYEYVYFNEWFGGIDKAYGNYELDYYYHSTREASKWVIKHAEKSGLETTGKIKVATWHASSVGYFFRNDTAKFDIGFSRWHERGNNDWDYAIFTVTGMSPDMLKHSEAFPPVNTVYQVKVDDKPIAVVLKRTDKSDYYGNILKSQGQLDSAIILFQKSLTVVPSDESVLLNLGEIYLNKRQYDSSIFYLDKLLAFDQKNESANYYKAYALMFQNRLDEAQNCLQVIVNHNPKNEIAPWMAAQIYAQQGNLILMEKMIERTLIANAGKQQDALNLMKQIYPQMGFSANDATYAFTKIWIRVLEKLGYKEEAEQLKKQR